MIGYISDNLLIPILDFFYGLVPSYGLAIVALTIVIRVALYPLSAGSIRSARRMRIAQPVTVSYTHLTLPTNREV